MFTAHHAACRYPRGGMAELLGSGGSARYASPQVSRKPQAGDVREEVGGSTTVGWRSDPQGEYRMPKSQKPGGTKWLASRLYQIKTGHCLTGQYLNWTKKSTHPAMLVVPVPEPDSGAPLQGVSGVEGPAEDAVRGGTEGDWEGERPVEDPGSPGG